MGVKISSNAGHSNPPGDPGACGSAQSKPILNGQTEAILNRNMNAAFINMGRERGYEMHDGTQANGSTANQAGGANSFGADLAVSHHFNGSVNPAASGVLICIHKFTNAANKVFARELAAAISAAFGIPNLGIQERADLNFLNRTSMAAVLIEWGFTSSPSDMQKILSNGMAGIRAAWDVIEKHYPVAKPLQTEPPVSAPKQSAEYKELMAEYVAVNAELEKLRAAHNILATKYEDLNKDLDALAGKY